MSPSRWVGGSRVRDHVWSEPAGAAETPGIYLAVAVRALHPEVKLLASPTLSFPFNER